MAARNMYRIEMDIHEKKKIVRQVGYLQRSYQDARSTKHNISGATFNCITTRAEKNYANSIHTKVESTDCFCLLTIT